MREEDKLRCIVSAIIYGARNINTPRYEERRFINEAIKDADYIINQVLKSNG